MTLLHSASKLGWAFAKVLFRRIFGPRTSQLPTFVSHYERDGIVPFADGDTATLEGASRCTACGQCDTRALLDGTYEALGPDGPRAFVLGVSRHSGEHDAAQLGPAATRDALEALTESCPVRVPFVPLSDLVRRRHDAQARARAIPDPLARARALEAPHDEERR